MAELEERLTNEYSKLAEQYAKEQKQLREQVEQLAAQVKQLAEQQDSDLKRYIEWSKTLGEQVTHLGGASAEIGRTARGRVEGVRRVERAHGRAARTLERTCRLGIQRAIEAFGREVKKIKFTRDRGLPERGLAKRWRERSRGWER